jgi:hypothetical protein
MRRLFADDPELLVWWTSEVECASAVTRLEHEGVLTRTVAAAALARLEELRAAWQEVEPGESVRRAARRVLRIHALRAADALQLAAALVASEGDPSSLAVVSLDSRLAEAAEREGFAVLSG